MSDAIQFCVLPSHLSRTTTLGVKLYLLLSGRTTDRGCVKKKRWDEYVNWKKKKSWIIRRMEKITLMISFKICVLRIRVITWKRGRWNACGRWEMHPEFRFENLIISLLQFGTNVLQRQDHATVSYDREPMRTYVTPNKWKHNCLFVRFTG